MSRKSSGRRRSLINEVRNTSFLRRSFIAPNNSLSTEECMEMLMKEKEQWKHLMEETKSEVSKKLKKIVIKEHNELPYFSSEDEQFMNSRPDYIAMLQSAKRFLQTLVMAEKLRRDHEDYCEEVLRELQLSKDALLNDLLVEKLCSICNDGLCFEDIHCLPDCKSAYIPEYSSHFILE